MQVSSYGWNETLGWLIICLFLTTIFLILGVVLKKTNGLFLARLPQQFLIDRDDPKFEKERRVGKKMQQMAYRYILPLALLSWLIFILSLLYKK